MPAIPAQGWPSCMAAFARVINGVARCMTYLRFWPALFGVLVDSRASSAPTDTTGTFDLPGSEKHGLRLRMLAVFRRNGDVIDACDSRAGVAILYGCFCTRYQRRRRVQEVSTVI
jgi:hypothetical protein